MQVTVIDPFCGRDSLQAMEHGGPPLMLEILGFQTCWRLRIPCGASL